MHKKIMDNDDNDEICPLDCRQMSMKESINQGGPIAVLL